jgi:ABC-type multidrug transport system fused ATPase/permease subunit
LNVFPWLFDNIMRSKRSFDNFLELMNKKELKSLQTNATDDDLILKNITIKYKKKSGFALKITENPFIAKRGEITVIYGNNGTGKSLLLTSLINEAHLERNEQAEFNFTNKNIAYVPQELWTFLGTIMENIIIGRELENYDKLIEKCCLSEDLKNISADTSIFKII